MWYLEKDITISAAHHLRNYDGACRYSHGHNWKITIYCKGRELDERGMLIDFKEIKRVVDLLDHVNLNDFSTFKKLNPTAENIARFLYSVIPYCYKVLVEEQEGSRCIYVEDKD